MMISVIYRYYIVMFIGENQNPRQSCELCTTTGAQSVVVLSRVSGKPHLGWQREVTVL